MNLAAFFTKTWRPRVLGGGKQDWTTGRGDSQMMLNTDVSWSIYILCLICLYPLWKASWYTNMIQIILLFFLLSRCVLCLILRKRSTGKYRVVLELIATIRMVRANALTGRLRGDVVQCINKTTEGVRPRMPSEKCLVVSDTSPCLICLHWNYTLMSSVRAIANQSLSFSRILIEHEQFQLLYSFWTGLGEGNNCWPEQSQQFGREVLNVCMYVYLLSGVWEWVAMTMIILV